MEKGLVNSLISLRLSWARRMECFELVNRGWWPDSAKCARKVLKSKEIEHSRYFDALLNQEKERIRCLKSFEVTMR